MSAKAVALALLCVTGCASTYMPRTLWSESSTELTELWAVRAHATHEIGYLAAVEFESENEHRSFTLELFFREPDTYMLRGRGTLGATGFRARVWGDSLVLLLNRQKRGYAGLADDYADQETLEMWRLLRAALPWLTGEMELDSDRMGGAYAATRIRVVEHGGRPDTVLIDLGPDQLKIGYGRFWDGYPYWHIRSATGESDKARLTLEFRQQLYNTQMDSALFRLELPPGTGPLVD